MNPEDDRDGGGGELLLLVEQAVGRSHHPGAPDLGRNSQGWEDSLMTE